MLTNKQKKKAQTMNISCTPNLQSFVAKTWFHSQFMVTCNCQELGSLIDIFWFPL